MKIDITATSNAARRVADRARIVAAAIRLRLGRELRDELQSAGAFEPAADPETRRDALERAVRRIWGATL